MCQPLPCYDFASLTDSHVAAIEAHILFKSLSSCAGELEKISSFDYGSAIEFNLARTIVIKKEKLSSAWTRFWGCWQVSIKEDAT